jgi:protein-tyrosine phosphatase
MLEYSGMKKQFRDIMNFRDLGGYETADHHHVQKGLFYRSAGLYFFTEEEKQAFTTLGIRFILDLRTSSEAAAHPDPIFPSIRMVRHSGVVSKGGEEIDFSPKGMGQIGQAGKEQYEALLSYYEKMPYQNEAFHVLFHEIDENNLPIVFHCATGKDRTGVAAMLILLLLGVDRETVLQDYLLSNTYRAEDIAHIRKEKEANLQDPYGKKLIMMQAGVLEEVGNAVLDSIFKTDGSPENYFRKEYGYDETKIMEFRQRFTE